MCQHNNQLQRHHRTFWQKLRGIKEVYRCTQCGKIIKIK